MDLPQTYCLQLMHWRSLKLGQLFSTPRCQRLLEKSPDRCTPEDVRAEPRCAMPPWSVCISRRNPEGHKRWNASIEGGRFSRSPSPGPEDTLTGVGGPARPGPFPSVLSCLPLMQLRSLRWWTRHPAPSLTTSTSSPHRRPPEAKKVFCPPWACFLIIKWQDYILSISYIPLFFLFP